MQKEAVKAAPRIMAEVIGEKLKARESGWVNDPDRGKAVLVQAKTGCVLLDDKGKPILRPRIAYPKTPNIDLGDFVKHLKRPEVENFVPYMYLDSKGNVTVGIGILLETAQEAISLDFVDKQTGKPVHPKHKEKAYNKVKAFTPNLKWPLYEPLTSIVISAVDATALTLDFINKVLAEIRSVAVYPDFDSFPVPAKMEILDMVYTIGSGNILTEWPKFTAAVRRRDWKRAGKEAKERKDSTTRKTQLNIWFTQAASDKSEKFFLDPFCRPKSIIPK